MDLQHKMQDLSLLRPTQLTDGTKSSCSPAGEIPPAPINQLQRLGVCPSVAIIREQIKKAH